MLEFQQLESFVEVANLLNFSKAADKLHITQSTMSARIQKLENDLGAPLFIRMGKAIRLSKYGEIFLPYALQSIEAINKGVKKIESEKLDNWSKLTMSAANPFATIILPHVLTALHEHLPDISIQVLRSTGYSEEILRMVTESKIDIAFVNDANLSGVFLDMSAIGVTPLYEDDFVLMAKPSHQLVQRKEILPEDLVEYRFLFMGSKTSVARHISSYFEKRQLKLTETIEINSIPSIKEMVKKTEMLTFFPRLIVTEELKKGELIEIAVAEPPTPLTTSLVYRQDYSEPEILKIITDKVFSCIREMNLPCRPIQS